MVFSFIFISRLSYKNFTLANACILNFRITLPLQCLQRKVIDNNSA